VRRGWVLKVYLISNKRRLRNSYKPRTRTRITKVLKKLMSQEALGDRKNSRRKPDILRNCRPGRIVALKTALERKKKINQRLDGVNTNLWPRGDGGARPVSTSPPGQRGRCLRDLIQKKHFRHLERKSDVYLKPEQKASAAMSWGGVGSFAIRNRFNGLEHAKAESSTCPARKHLISEAEEFVRAKRGSGNLYEKGGLNHVLSPRGGSFSSVGISIKRKKGNDSTHQKTAVQLQKATCAEAALEVAEESGR